MIENETGARGRTAVRSGFEPVSVDGILRRWTLAVAEYEFTASNILPEQGFQLTIPATPPMGAAALVVFHRHIESAPSTD